MVLMLSKRTSYLFLCLIPYNCVFCRNEENETKSKQFGQEIRKLCSEEVVFFAHPHEVYEEGVLVMMDEGPKQSSRTSPMSIAGL